MSFLVPEAGLLFWMLVAFGVVFFVLYKYAFPAITSMIDERKKFIDDALANAKEANEKLGTIQQQGDELLRKAQDEQSRILNEAIAMRNNIIGEARKQALLESEKLLDEARSVITHEKEQAMREIRNQVAELSLAIAEKVVRRELSGDSAQQFARSLVDEAIKDNSDK